MTLESRIAKLQALHRAPYKLHTSVRTVKALDAFLADVYGIAEPTTPTAALVRLKEAAEGNRDARRLLRAMEERYGAHSQGGSTEHADAKVYALMSAQPFLGWIHSLKRAYILDAAAALSALVEQLEVRGPVLDVGCHAGYHANWLAKQTGVLVTGIDPAARAIAVATNLKVAHARFVASDVKSLRSDTPFELIYSIDGPFWFRRYDPLIADFFDRELQRGGLFVVVGEAPPPFTSVTSLALRYGLQPLLSDVIGGWHGDRFEGEPLLVFVRTDKEISLPEDLDQFDAGWDRQFISYANRSNTPWKEKTQAFFRAARLAPE